MAAVSFELAPSDIRFKPVCDYIAAQLIVMAASNPLAGTGRRLSELRSGVAKIWRRKLVSTETFEANNTSNGKDIKDSLSSGSQCRSA